MLVKRFSVIQANTRVSTQKCNRKILTSQKTTPALEQSTRTTRRKVHGLGKFPMQEYRNHQDGPADYSHRNFAYGMVAATGVVGTVMVKNAVGNFVSTLYPARNQLAVSNVEVDLKKVPLGTSMTFEWRGKPLMVRHREDWEIEAARNTPLSELKDPQTDDERIQDPAYLVVLGVCTHLGCVPIPGQGNYKGFFCPCHGSHYDTSARIREGPAPLNLEVPPYHFKPSEEKVILVGVGKDEI